MNLYSKLPFIAACVAAVAFSAPVSAQSLSWQNPHTGDAATGSGVIALWKFDNDSKDASANKHNLRLRGKDTHLSKEGKFGGALLVEDKAESGDKRQGATVQNSDNLNPKGAFTLEMWISPSAQLFEKKAVTLLDKKYIYSKSSKPNANTAYALRLIQESEDEYFLEAHLGFGDDSAILRSQAQPLEANQWYHVAFTYDGKGLGTFYFNGANIGDTQLKDRGAIVAGTRSLVIGDRVGSVGSRFLGKIDEVRILDSAIQYASGKVLFNAAESRTAFYRKEKDAAIRVQVSNDTETPLKNANLQADIAGIAGKTTIVPELEAGKSTFITLPFNSNLRPDKYDATIRLTDQDNVQEMTLPLTIVPRPLPNQMPINMWARATKDYKQLTDIGYTGELVTMVNYGHIWDGGKSSTAMPENSLQTVRKQIDDMLAAQVFAWGSLNPGKYAMEAHPEFNRVNRRGKEIVKGSRRKLSNLDALYPETQEYAYNVGAAVARSFGDLPGLQGTHIGGEVRDRNAPSFNDIDIETYRKFSGGQEIPNEVSSVRGVNYRALINFPANRIIPADDPILSYYRWFWKEGDGWPQFLSKVSDGFKANGSAGLETWTDPATRVPSLYGGGANTDFINNWTYTYPNPLKSDLSTNELLAMAEGRPGQKVMPMIQIIWYRSGTTKTPAKGQETEWEKMIPDANFISIAPDHLSAATWMELSYPVDAIANHGWGSLGDKIGFKQGSYYTSNVDTRKRMTDVFQNVVKPLAPTLLQVPDYQTDVAFLQSFTSQMFSNVGTYGWGNGWGADSYILTRYAGLQPRIIYEETIQQKGLDQYKVLFLMDCPVLTEDIAKEILEYQRRGGIIVADENLTPAIQPDIIVPSLRRDAPDKTKQLLQKRAVDLRENLDQLYQLPLESNNPDVITRLRQKGNTSYIFTINDHRTYGDYVGQYKKVMEKGLPSTAEITLNRATGFVYDLMNHRQVQVKSAGEKVLFPVELEAGGGNLFLVTDKPIGKLQISVASAVKRGEQTPIKVLLSDETNGKLDAIIPMEVTIRDAQGRATEASGYYGATDGQLQIDLDVAPNDAVGKWSIEVTEGLTGQKQTAAIAVS